MSGRDVEDIFVFACDALPACLFVHADMCMHKETILVRNLPELTSRLLARLTEPGGGIPTLIVLRFGIPQADC